MPCLSMTALPSSSLSLSHSNARTCPPSSRSADHVLAAPAARAVYLSTFDPQALSTLSTLYLPPSTQSRSRHQASPPPPSLLACRRSRFRVLSRTLALSLGLSHTRS
eukprot:513719-Pleurochrysis_carterae.AAC.1